MKVTILSTFLVAFSGLVLAARSNDRVYPISIKTIDESNPDSVSGTSNGNVTMKGGKHTNAFLVFPNPKPGKTCKFSFQGQKTNSGAPTVKMNSIDQPPFGSTWNNRPKPGQSFGTFDVSSAGDKVASWDPGNPTFTCPGSADSIINIELSASGTEDMSLTWDPKSGLYLVAE